MSPLITNRSLGIRVKLSILGFQYNLLPVSSNDIGLKEKIIDQLLAWQSGHKLPQGHPEPLEPILLGDLVRYHRPL